MKITRVGIDLGKSTFQTEGERDTRLPRVPYDQARPDVSLTSESLQVM